MNPDALAVLKLMFDFESGTACFSDSKFGFHSVPISSYLSGKVKLVSPKIEVPIKEVDSDKLIFVAINEIKGFRTDANVRVFKNFMLECDVGSIESQIQYLKTLEIPYSAITFSGSKSAHILIALDRPIDSEKAYRTIYEWLLNIGTLFDPAVKNPSRSIRIPGAIRPETGKEQKLLEIKGLVKKADLFAFLAKNVDKKPKQYEKKAPSENYDYNNIPRWVIKLLQNGLDRSKSRNLQWFQIASEFALANVDREAAIEFLSRFFTPERDFKEKEFLTTIRSAYTIKGRE